MDVSTELGAILPSACEDISLDTILEAMHERKTWVRKAVKL